MEQDFLTVYNRLRVKMFYATIAIFSVRYSVVLYLNTHNHDYNLLYFNAASFLIFVLDFVYLYFNNEKIRSATLILVYDLVISIFILNVLDSGKVNSYMYLVRDLITLNILVLITAFMTGKRNTFIFTGFLISAFVFVSFVFQILVFKQFLLYIIFFIVAGCFIYSLLANLIETTVKMSIEAKKEVEHLSQFKHNVIRLIFHDLKVPVSSIIDLNREEKTDKASKTVYYAESIKKQLENVLDVERLEEPELKLETKEKSIAEIVNHAIKSVEVLAFQKSIKIVCSLQTTGLLLCDQNLIERVCINLLSNAIKYSTANKTVIIQVTNTDDVCNIMVKDEGIGIKAEHLDKLFIKYYKIDPDMSHSQSSNGLGLTFCKLAVQAHQGSIEVHSSEHQGSEFLVKLPGFKKLGIETASEISTLYRVNLSTANKLKLKLLCEQIIHIPLYKIGEIVPLIKQFEKDPERDIRIWLEQLSDAVYSGNHEYFQTLLSQIISNPNEYDNAQS